MKKGTQLSQNTYIIIGFIVLSIIIIGIVALFYAFNKSNSATVAQNEYVDPNSGETIVRPDGKSPETYNVNPNTPTYLGFSKLYDYGLQQAVVDNTKAFLNDYANQRIVNKQEKITEVSLNVESINHIINKDTSENSYTFKVVVNRKDTVTVKLSLEGVIGMTAVLYESDITKPILTKTYDL